MTEDLFFLMLVWHYIADYPLQGDFLAKAKNESAPIVGVPWYQAMFAHSMIHAGGVTVITGSVALGLCEFVAHFTIDRAKCRGLISFDTDQWLHVVCKVLWALIAYAVLS